MKLSPADVLDNILHEVALAEAESRPPTRTERRIARNVKKNIDALIRTSLERAKRRRVP